MKLANSGSNIVDRKTDESCDECGAEKCSRVYKAVFSESGVETFFEVVIGASKRYVEDEVPQDVHFETLPHFSRGSQLTNGLKRTIGVVSPPVRVDLNVELLTNRHQGEGVRYDGTSNTSNSSDERFFTVTEIIVCLMRLEGVVEGSVKSVSDKEIAESRIEESVEACVENSGAVTLLLEHPQIFEGIVALLLD